MKKMLLLGLLLLFLFAGCGSGVETVSALSGSKAEMLDTGERLETDGNRPVEPPTEIDQSVALEAYNRLYETFCGPSGTWENARNVPKTYGGAYVDNEKGGILTICVTELSEDTRDYYFEVCGTEELTFCQVRYSYHDLLDAMDALSKYNQTHDTPLCFSWGLDEMNNCVPITVSPEMESEALTLQAEYPAIAVTVDQPVLIPADHSTYGSDDRVTLTVPAEPVSSDTEYLPCVLRNGADQGIYFSEFELDTLVDGVWYSVPCRPDIAFTASLPWLEAGQEQELSCWLSMFSTELSAGTYRLCMPWCVDYTPMQGRDWDHMAFAEFTVED